MTLELTEEMEVAGVAALQSLCPLDICFPVGGERDAVRAVWRAMQKITDDMIERAERALLDQSFMDGLPTHLSEQSSTAAARDILRAALRVA